MVRVKMGWRLKKLRRWWRQRQKEIRDNRGRWWKFGRLPQCWARWIEGGCRWRRKERATATTQRTCARKGPRWQWQA